MPQFAQLIKSCSLLMHKHPLLAHQITKLFHSKMEDMVQVF